MNKVSELKNNQLIEMNWKDLKKILYLLKSFKKLIVLKKKYKILYDSIDLVLWKFDIFLEKLKKKRKKSKFLNILYQRILNISWVKLYKYYKLINENSIYIITRILNSCMKYQYFKHQWKSNWFIKIINKIYFIFNQYWEKEFISNILWIINIIKNDDDNNGNNNLFDFNKW